MDTKTTHHITSRHKKFEVQIGERLRYCHSCNAWIEKGDPHVRFLYTGADVRANICAACLKLFYDICTDRLSEEAKCNCGAPKDGSIYHGIVYCDNCFGMLRIHQKEKDNGKDNKTKRYNK